MRPRHLTYVAALALLALSSIVATAAGATKPDEIKVVAIGDSYIAGNGNTNYYAGQGPNQPDSGGPRVPAEGRNCFQSYSSYPWQFVQKLNDTGHPATIWHAACGGAWTYDLIPQWNTVPSSWRGNADIVLISAGGNDARFGDIVAHCLMGLPGNTTCDDDLAHARRELPAAIDRIRQAIETISVEAPNARIAIVGYPLLASPANQRCPSRGEEQLNEIQWAHEVSLIALTHDLNQAAGLRRFTPVVVSSRFTNRGPCAWRNALLHNYFAADGEHFHPNWWGAHEYAETLYDYRIHEDLQ